MKKNHKRLKIKQKCEFEVKVIGEGKDELFTSKFSWRKLPISEENFETLSLQEQEYTKKHDKAEVQRALMNDLMNPPSFWELLKFAFGKKTGKE